MSVSEKSSADCRLKRNESNHDLCGDGEADCTPVKPGEKGVLLLSFDDRNFEGWLAARPIFEKYHAHATFFVSGPIDDEAVKVMKTLSDAGHSVGLHGLNHLNADNSIKSIGAEEYYSADITPQTDCAERSHIPFTSFAYPNCRHSEESDALFYSRGFYRVRAGVPGATPYDPTGELQANRRSLPTYDAVFFPSSELAGHRCIDTILIGEAYHTDIDEILACLKRAAEKKEVISITSHDIAPDAKYISMKNEWLEQILACAQSTGLAVIGFDELPVPCLG